MTPYAAVADLEKGWRTLSDSEKTIAEALLARASRMIAALCPGAATADADLLADIACASVKRAMAAGGDNVTSRSMTGGPYSEQLSYANPAGDLYLTKVEKRLLGCGVMRAYETGLPL
jgi:hypothetical protein